MAYHKFNSTLGNNSTANQTGFHDSGGKTGQTVEFYPLEEAVVLDVILDANHPEIKTLSAQEWPDNYKGETPAPTDKNYTYIGRALVRMLHSQKGMPKDKLIWAKPMFNTGVVEFPILHEIVIVAKYRNEWYYTQKLNSVGNINNNANFNVELAEGNTDGTALSNTITTDYPKSQIGSTKTSDVENSIGILGKYFVANNRLRAVRKFEGDTCIESRHGQSIRFSAYDINRKNDRGFSLTYKGSGAETNSVLSGAGNPMILIRNRQRQLATDKDIVIHPLLPPIKKISDVEKNAGGIIEEDINHDGSSIQMTSGLTETKWKTTIYKSIFLEESEEQALFSPSGSTKYTMPVLNGDQIVINSDRILLSARFGEIFINGKKRISAVTDGEYTVDSDNQIVFTTNTKTVFNSPAIYLGQYDQTNEPALLGQTTVDWLYDLCEWIKKHTHWYKHSHPDAGEANPDKTQIPVEIAELMALQARLKSLMSRRVFLTGGGYAPGANGVSPTKTDAIHKPVIINTNTGEGVPGLFTGKNSKKFNK